MYLNRLEEIYDKVDILGNKVAELLKKRDSLTMRYLLQSLSTFAELLRVKYALVESEEVSLEECGRIVKDATKFQVMLYSDLSSDRAEEDHGW